MLPMRDNGPEKYTVPKLKCPFVQEAGRHWHPRFSDHQYLVDTYIYYGLAFSCNERKWKYQEAFSIFFNLSKRHFKLMNYLSSIP